MSVRNVCQQIFIRQLQSASRKTKKDADPILELSILGREAGINS